ncbi:hypothetical protein [Pseudomonas sp. H2_E05]
MRELPTGGYFKVDLPAGVHRISSNKTSILTDEATRQFDLPVKAGQSYFVVDQDLLGRTQGRFPPWGR